MLNATLEQATETFPECLISLARSNLKLNLSDYLKPPRCIAFGSRDYGSWIHVFSADRRDLLFEIRSETDIGHCDVTVDSMHQSHGKHVWNKHDIGGSHKRYRGKRTAIDVKLSDGKQFVIHMSRASVPAEAISNSREISSEEYNKFQYARE